MSELRTIEEIERTKRVRVVRQSIRSLAGLMTKKKIAVVQRGTQASCEFDRHTGEPIKIVLPVVADDASNDMLDAIQGFLDHECAHALFTEFQVLVDAQRLKVGFYQNMYEDLFIERKIAEILPGVRSTLPKPRHVVISTIREKEATMLASSDYLAMGEVDQMIQRWNLYCVCSMRALADNYEFVDFMKEDDRWAAIQPVIDKLTEAGVIKRLKLIKDSKEALDLAVVTRSVLLDIKAESIKEEMKKERPEKTEKSDLEPEDSDSPDSDSAAGDTESDSCEDSEASPEEDEGDDDDLGEDATGSDATADSEDDAEPEEGDGEDDGSGDSGEDEDDDDDDEGDGDGDEEDGDKEARDRAEKELDEPDDSLSMEGALSEAISDGMMDLLAGKSYVPYTTERDKVGREYANKSAGLHRCDLIQNRVDEETGVMSQQLQSVMAANDRSWWQSGLRKGRVSQASLYRLSAGDDRVFRNRESSERLNTVVSLVVDMSGSMAGTRIQAAALSAWALGQTLSGIGIACEIIGFTTEGIITEPEARRYSRFEPLMMPVFKEFDEPFSDRSRETLAALHDGQYRLDQNVDGECVRIAADRLLLRAEQRKIMIVLSDGSPCSHASGVTLSNHMVEVSKEVAKEGVELFGIGIETDSVHRFYDHCDVINNLRDLGATVVGKLSEFLLKGYN